jgi:hypothetical protein
VPKQDGIYLRQEEGPMEPPAGASPELALEADAQGSDHERSGSRTQSMK